MNQSNIPFQTWDLDLLTDYVLKFHHRNTRKYGALLLKRLMTLGERHHELDKVTDHFRNSIHDLDTHCQKEENVLFPYILELWSASELNQKIQPFHCGSIEFPIHAMMEDHSDELSRHQRIEELTNGYQAPAGSEEEYRQVLDALRQFRAYMEEHIYVENEILFPRALQLEAKHTVTLTCR